MNGIENTWLRFDLAGYLTDERSLVPLTIVLATVVAFLAARLPRGRRGRSPPRMLALGASAPLSNSASAPPANSIRRDLPALSPLLCNRGRLSLFYVSLTPQSAARGVGAVAVGKLYSGLHPLMALPETAECGCGKQ